MAAPYFILTFFEELLEKKQLVLMRGDIIDYKIDKMEGKNLYKEMIKFYLNEDLYSQFVYNFNNN